MFLSIFAVIRHNHSTAPMDQPKIERLLRLMKMLSGNLNYTVEDLADRLHTSPRSIYRYLETFKEAGFVVHKLEGGVYRLGKESPYFKDLSQLIHFTDEEAYIVGRLIDALDDTNLLKQNLRRKLSSVYECTSMVDIVVKGKNAINVQHLVEAITSRRQAILHNYASSHTGVVRDRLVEPFAFTTNYIQVWCYEPESGSCKLFSTSRIQSVEVKEEVEWQYADRHHEGHIDIFRIAGYERTRIQLKLGVMAHNLLLEEFPLAERDIKSLGKGEWMLDTEVCSLAGVGRFVMGLADDIEIIDSPELVAYLKEKSRSLHVKIENQ